MLANLDSHDQKKGHSVTGVEVAHCQCRWSSADEVQLWDKGSMLPWKYRRISVIVLSLYNVGSIVILQPAGSFAIALQRISVSKN